MRWAVRHFKIPEMNYFAKILLFIFFLPVVGLAQQELVPVSYDTLKLKDEVILENDIDPRIEDEYLHAKYWNTSDELELFVEIFYIAGKDTLQYLQEEFYYLF